MMDDIKEELTNLKLALVRDGRNIFQEKVLALAPAIIVHVESGVIVYASDSVNQMFDYIPNELEGLQVSDLLPTDFRARHAGHLKDYLKAPRQRNMGVHGMVLKGQKKNSSIFEVKISLYPFVEDRVLYVVAFLMEV